MQPVKNPTHWLLLRKEKTVNFTSASFQIRLEGFVHNKVYYYFSNQVVSLFLCSIIMTTKLGFKLTIKEKRNKNNIVSTNVAEVNTQLPMQQRYTQTSNCFQYL